MQDAALHEGARSSLTGERYKLLEFLMHLDEIDRRSSYERLGKPSLWAYCTDVLGLTSAEAFLRVQAVRLIRRFPEAAERIRDGRLTLSALVTLRHALKKKNATELFDAAQGKSKKELKQLLMMRQAPIAARSEIRQVTGLASIVPVPHALVKGRSDVAAFMAAGLAANPAASNEGPPSAADGESRTAGATAGLGGALESSGSGTGGGAQELGASGNGATELPAFFLVVGPERVQSFEPVSMSQAQLTVTIDKAFEADLEELRIALSHVVPDGDLAKLLHHCVKRVLAADAKKNGISRPKDAGREADAGRARDPKAEAVAAVDGKHEAAVGRAVDAEYEAAAARAVGAKPTAAAPRKPASKVYKLRDRAPRNRPHIPSGIRREVWRRDRGRCVYRLEDGSVCGSRWQCQIDHVIPVARSGRTELSNLRVFCRAHNLQAEREVFGEAFVDRIIGSKAEAGVDEPPQDGSDAAAEGRGTETGARRSR